MLVLTVLAGTVVGPSVVGALLAPGTDSVAARLAECGRDHGFDGLITWLEKQQYEHNPPPTGGMPVGGISRVAIAPDTPADPLDAVGLPARLLCPHRRPFRPSPAKGRCSVGAQREDDLAGRRGGSRYGAGHQSQLGQRRKPTFDGPPRGSGSYPTNGLFRSTTSAHPAVIGTPSTPAPDPQLSPDMEPYRGISALASPLWLHIEVGRRPDWTIGGR